MKKSTLGNFLLFGIFISMSLILSILTSLPEIILIGIILIELILIPIIYYISVKMVFGDEENG